MNWLNEANDIVTCFEVHGKVISGHKIQKATKYMTISFVCLPCILWSTVFRVIACPFQCIINGPSFLCSDNVMTDESDTCVSIACEQVKNQGYLKKMPRDLDTDLKKALFQRIKTILTNTNIYTYEYYEFCDYIFKNTFDDSNPYNIKHYITNELQRLMNAIFV